MFEDALKIVAERAAGAPVEKAASVGRNDPCPCGSGRKYKQCCLRKGGPPVARRTLDPSAFIPRIHDKAQLLTDLRRFGQLMELDPVLRAYQFDPAAAAAFADAHENAATHPDIVGQKFVEAHVEPEYFVALDLALTQAVRRHLPSVDDVRALLCALMLLAPVLNPALPAPSSNPVIGLLFERAVATVNRDALSEVFDAFRGLVPGGGDVTQLDRDTLMTVADTLNARFDGNAAVEAALKRTFGRRLDALIEAVDNHEIPIGLPLATAWPLLIVSTGIKLQADAEPDTERTRQARTEAIREVVAESTTDEDQRLAIAFIREWLEDHTDDADTDVEVFEHVRLLCAVLESEGLEGWLYPLFKNGVEHGFSMFDDEPTDLADVPGHPDDLERCAEVYARHGYPGIAARTRALVERGRELVRQSR